MNNPVALQIQDLLIGGLEMLGLPCERQKLLTQVKHPEHGHYASNVAMVLSKQTGKPPMELAQAIVDVIPGNLDNSYIEQITIVKPGFINFKINAFGANAIIEQVLCDPCNWGRFSNMKGKKVLVEFVSANPTGPLHTGHARNAVLGDCIANALSRLGYEVVREYYCNDAGDQVIKLGKSLRHRYLEFLDLEPGVFPEEYYQGEYVKDLASQLYERTHGRWVGRSANDFAVFGELEIMDEIIEDLNKLGIQFQLYQSEQFFHAIGANQVIVTELLNTGSAYKQDDAIWLKTEDEGDSHDRILVRQDGRPTYIVPDIAYHKVKYERGFDMIVNLLGADHHNYVIRLRAAMRALGYDPDKMKCVVYQLVTVMKDGEEVRVGKRAGNYITLNEMLLELGSDAIRYFFAMHRADTAMVFDWNLAQEQSMKNPVYYVQYAHARCCSIEQKYDGIRPHDPIILKDNLLSAPEEIALANVLAEFPEVVLKAAAEMAPHLYCAYTFRLAEHLNRYFTAGKTNHDLRVLCEAKPELTLARFRLVQAVRLTLKESLSVLGIKAPTSMARINNIAVAEEANND